MGPTAMSTGSAARRSHQTHAPRPRARLITALLAGKSAAGASRILGRGGGTSVSGMVARRVDPAILGRLVAGCDVPVVAITGSNGKTTTARLTAALLRGEGVGVLPNAAGSNLAQGVTSVVVSAADWKGKLPGGILLVEVDEGTLPRIVAEIDPTVLVVTGIFRDQLDRFGELYAVADAIESAANELGPHATLVLNADDPLVANIASGRSGPRTTFGLRLGASTDEITRAADSIRCPRCRVALHFERVYLSHLGDYRCTSCGYERPVLDVAVTSLEVRGLAETVMRVRAPDGEAEVAVPQAGVHIAYDTAGALAACHGLGIRCRDAAASLAQVGPAFGRLEQIRADGRRVILAFAKNPTSFNTMLQTLAAGGEPRHLVVAVSNTSVDGEDFGWLWDVEFERIVPTVERVTVSGLRADELANRLKHAGTALDRIHVQIDRHAALDGALAAVPAGGTVVVLGGYTPTLEFRDLMRRRGWTNRFWQA
jgi:lipid II isoglutaminyl synthase (glutamine-hydrolysing)